MLNARISRVLHTRWLPVLGGLLVIGTLSGCGDGPVPTATSKATTTPVLAVMPTQTPTHTSAKKPTPTQLPMPTLGSVGAEEIEDDLDALLDGVIEIDAPGVPGPLCVYGSEAFPVIVGRVSGYGTKAFPASSILRAPEVAAGRRQAGRIVALGHDGYFARATLESLDTGRLIKNRAALGRWWRAVRSSHWRRRRRRAALVAQGGRARCRGSLADAQFTGDGRCRGRGNVESGHAGDRSAVGICGRWRRFGDGRYRLGLGATAPRPRPHQRLHGQPSAHARRHTVGQRLACPHVTGGATRSMDHPLN